MIDAIIAAARECIGTPFQHQGRRAGQALDCAGVLVHVAQRLGVEYWDVAAYGRMPHAGLLEATLDAQPCLLRVTERQPGDLLLMRFTGDPQHLAVCAGETIIHAYQRAGKCCEHRLDAVWARRIVRVYRFTA